MVSQSFRGIDAVRKLLATLAKDAKRIVERAIGEYLIGDVRHGLTHYPQYKHIKYSQAYGGFKSDKQRRYVMAAIREGTIDPGVPHRTGELQRGWKLVDMGRYYVITNHVPYAGYVMGEQQARLPQMVGWRKMGQVISSNMAGALRAGVAALNKLIRERR